MVAGVPLARWSLPELRREVLTRGLVATVSGTTLWRWLDADAIRPWRHRSWLFPRDPQFAECADPILDLYECRWDGRPLGPRDYVISAEEKTSLGARCASNTNIVGAGRGRIWRHGTSTALASLGNVRRGAASRPLTASSNRS